MIQPKIWKSLVYPDFPHVPGIVQVADAEENDRLFRIIRSRCIIIPPRAGGTPIAAFETDWLRRNSLRVAALYDHEASDEDQEAIMQAMAGGDELLGTAISSDDAEAGSVWRLQPTADVFCDVCYSYLQGSVLIFHEKAPSALVYDQDGLVFWAAPEVMIRATLGSSLALMMDGIAAYQDRSRPIDGERALDRDFAHYGELLLNAR